MVETEQPRVALHGGKDLALGMRVQLLIHCWEPAARQPGPHLSSRLPFCFCLAAVSAVPALSATGHCVSAPAGTAKATAAPVEAAHA